MVADGLKEVCGGNFCYMNDYLTLVIISFIVTQLYHELFSSHFLSVHYFQLRLTV